MKNFTSLHIKNDLGTDVVIGLDKVVSWEDEEGTIRATPDQFCITGTIVASKPLRLGDTVIKGATIILAEGQVVECFSRTNEDAFRELLELNKESLAKLVLSKLDSYFKLGTIELVFGTEDTMVTASTTTGQDEVLGIA